jgi:hypothetical protein
VHPEFLEHMVGLHLQGRCLIYAQIKRDLHTKSLYYFNFKSYGSINCRLNFTFTSLEILKIFRLTFRLSAKNNLGRKWSVAQKSLGTADKQQMFRLSNCTFIKVSHRNIILNYMSLLRIWDKTPSSVGMGIRLWAAQPRKRGSISERGKRFLSPL